MIWRTAFPKRAGTNPEAKTGGAPGNDKKRQDKMLRIFKFLILIALIAFAGLVGYAYLGDLTPERGDVTVPVELNVRN